MLKGEAHLSLLGKMHRYANQSINRSKLEDI